MAQIQLALKLHHFYTQKTFFLKFGTPSWTSASLHLARFFTVPVQKEDGCPSRGSARTT